MGQANFRVDDSQWEQFKELCSTNDKTASEILKLFIDDVLASRIDITKLGQAKTSPLDINNLVTDLVNQQVQQHLANIDYLIETKVNEKLEQSQKQLTPVAATTEVKGLTSDELAQILGVTTKTVNKHRKDDNYNGWFYSIGYWYKNEELPLEYS